MRVIHAARAYGVLGDLTLAPRRRCLHPSSYFHTAVLPPQWLPWTTDGAAPIEAGPAFLSHGMRCRGDYCDDVSLLAMESV